MMVGAAAAAMEKDVLMAGPPHLARLRMADLPHQHSADDHPSEHCFASVAEIMRDLR